MIQPHPPKTQSREAKLFAWVLCGRMAPDQPVSRVVLTDEVFTIGRHDQNRLCLPNRTVSGRHAELVSLPEGLLVRDLLSTNGTYLNGQRVEASQLAGQGDILQFGSAIFHLEYADPSTKPLTEKRDVADDCVGRLQFSKLFQGRGLRPFFQPIVRLNDELNRVGFEALARSQLVGLETPETMFQVAAERNAEIELSCLVRQEALRLASRLAPAEQIYLNTHPLELNDPHFLETICQLRRAFPKQSIVLEIHEAAVTDLGLLRRIRETLLALGMGLSYDDFGSGQARLLELGEVPPDVLKFDIQLIHDLPNATRERQRLVECLVKVTQEMGILALAECVETEAELVLCRELGFDLAQGFFLGQPAPVEHWSRQAMWLPQAIVVGQEVIKIFDPAYHHPSKRDSHSEAAAFDQRWIRVRRPTVIVGGELTLDSLEVRHVSPNVSEAPLQVKSNCGCLLIDDFGRQRVAPADLLNRWIIPLENRHDFLTLGNGRKIQVPFEQLIIFSTNIDPAELVDEAFLRRIRYKIEVNDPDEAEFHHLFELNADKMGYHYSAEAVEYLLEHYYRPKRRPLRRCHPRDLMQQVRNHCLYHEMPFEMLPEYFDHVARGFFTDVQVKPAPAVAASS